MDRTVFTVTQQARRIETAAHHERVNHQGPAFFATQGLQTSAVRDWFTVLQHFQGEHKIHNSRCLLATSVDVLAAAAWSSWKAVSVKASMHHGRHNT
jgi:hypothetical protein